MARAIRQQELPKGVEIPKGRNIVRIRFTYRDTECRELSLEPTPANIEYARAKVAEIRHLIELEKFNYGEHFPKSKRCKLFNEFASVNVTLKKVLDDYLVHVKPLVETVSYKHYEKLLRIYVRPTWDERSADKLTVPNLLDWIKELAAQGRGDKGLSLSTAQTAMVPFKCAVAHAVLMQVLATNPLEQIELHTVWPKDQRDSGYEPDPFTDEERAAVLAAASPEMRRMLTFWMWTGLRGQELIALKWSNVHLEQKRIYIDHVARDGKMVKGTKTESSKRYVPLFGPALRAIQDQRAATQLKGPDAIVWENLTTAKPYQFARQLNGKPWRSLLKRAGVRRRGPYQCRHTFASMMFANNELLPVISRILGHKHPGITLTYYTRMLERITPQNVHGFDLRGDYEKVAA